MLSNEEFEAWCSRRNLSDKTRKVIQHIRQSDPSRRVGGRRSNVSGQYPSRKMKFSIQFESHTVELPFVYLLEHDNDVLEFYDQPPGFKLNYQSANGRNLGHLYTPDFFVIKTGSAGWVECKTEQELLKLAEKSPNRFCRDENNEWIMPPGQKYAEELDLTFQVWSDAKINWNLYRNLQFLQGYYCVNSYQLKEATIAAITLLVSKNPGIPLIQLLNNEDITHDDIYFMITRELIYVDLKIFLLIEPEKSLVFRDEQTARAYQSLFLPKLESDVSIIPIINVKPGTSVIWDNQVLTIDLVGNTEILLHTEDKQHVELSIDIFHALAKQGKIIGLRQQSESSLSEESFNIFLSASEKDLEKANLRFKLIEPYLNSPVSDVVPQARNIRILKHKYQMALEKYGYGYLGLISLEHDKGNRNRKISSYILSIIERFIKEKYESFKQQSKLSIYSEFTAFCANDGVLDNEIPTYKTFRLEIKKCSGFEQTSKRGGRRAAYTQEPFVPFLTMSVSPHGERPFQIAHIDHTPADIQLRDSQTGKLLGKPWLTFLVDAFDRRILASYITFDPPSYRSCMMVFRNCVIRHGRLPETIVVDNGKEFHSNYFRALINFFGIILKYRPPSKARFNSVGERLFGIATTQLINNLAGNTQITKKIRQMTKSNNPENLALWTLGLFYFYLCEWAYEVYETTEHPALGQSPREAFLVGTKKTGNRLHTIIPYDANFEFITMPTTPKGKAKVDPRMGVTINYIPYWSDSFRDPEIQNTYVDVRFDPFDSKVAYAKVRQRWVKCDAFIPTLMGRSQKEIQIASQELRKRKQNHEKNFKVNARKLGEFLSTIEAEEILLEQRLRDAQLKQVFAIIEGKTPNLTPYVSSTNTENLEADKLNIATSISLDPDSGSKLDTSQLINFNKY